MRLATSQRSISFIVLSTALHCNSHYYMSVYSPTLKKAHRANHAINQSINQSNIFLVNVIDRCDDITCMLSDCQYVWILNCGY